MPDTFIFLYDPNLKSETYAKFKHTVKFTVYECSFSGKVMTEKNSNKSIKYTDRLFSVKILFCISFPF
jgi:phenolic acid decarboxylase